MSTISTWITANPLITSEFQRIRDTWVPGDPYPATPLPEAVFLVLLTFHDSPAVQGQYKGTDGNYTHFGLNFKNDTLADIGVGILEAEYTSGEVAIIGSWQHLNGLQQGLQYIQDEDGNDIAIYGDPTYPLDDNAYQVMPDIVTYDEDGNETSRTPATSNDDLRDINLIAGQHPRLFHVNEGPL